jgi:site-specific DNA-methyltransferase (adenine-specific)
MKKQLTNKSNILIEHKNSTTSLPINQIICGDCLEVLKTFPSNCIDTIITDPPYGLSDHNENKVRKVLQNWLNGKDDFVPDGKGFMGKSWDAFVPPPIVWKECFRVLKPGATILVFAGSRTYDLMTISLRLAGFEIKDTIMWLTGMGFPKSLNIALQFEQELCERKDNKWVYRDTGEEMRREPPFRNEQANLWIGYGTALKPAYEPIIMAMKPNDKNYVNNALKWGVAGLNIDGARIKYETSNIPKSCIEKYKNPTDRGVYGGSSYFVSKTKPFMENNPSPIGRFPANVILECTCDEVIERKHTNPECPCYMLDKQSGISKSQGGKTKRNTAFFGSGTFQMQGYYDKGGASRFFYCAKASRSERNMGLEGMPLKRAGGMQGRNNGSFDGKITYNQNHHPTVKPLKLMEYLCTLTKTPTGGIVVDPFAGSGTTGMACKKIGRSYILIEKNPEYVEIAKRRIDAIMIANKD